MPDGSQGWSLLILLSVQFGVQLGFGFVLTGLGGMLGVQHAPNIEALQSGLRQGVLDDILFPEDPVADAPRIINRLRVVFPPTPRALTIGPMVELGWGTPNIVTIRIGLIVQIDNAINSGGRPVSLSRIVLLGQLLVQVPPKGTQVPPVVKLLVAVHGWYDDDEASHGIDARLRDSKSGPLDVTGMLVVRGRFKDDPSFILSVGGFHPKFKDLPPGLPSPIDRIGVGFSIGPVKLSITSYVAVTSSTFQTGAAVDLSAKLGPAEIKGWLGYDALFQFEPTFHFIVDVRAGIAIKISGHRPAGGRRAAGDARGAEDERHGRRASPRPDHVRAEDGPVRSRHHALRRQRRRRPAPLRSRAGHTRRSADRESNGALGVLRAVAVPRPE